MRICLSLRLIYDSKYNQIMEMMWESNKYKLMYGKYFIMRINDVI